MSWPSRLVSLLLRTRALRDDIAPVSVIICAPKAINFLSSLSLIDQVINSHFVKPPTENEAHTHSKIESAADKRPLQHDRGTNQQPPSIDPRAVAHPAHRWPKKYRDWTAAGNDGFGLEGQDMWAGQRGES